MRMRGIVIIVMCSVLLLACASGAGSTAGMLSAPPVVTSVALRGTVEAEQVDQYMLAARAQSTIAAVRVMQTVTAIAGQEEEAAAAVRATATAWAVTVEADRVKAVAEAEAEMARLAAADRRAAEEQRVAQATATIEAIIFQQQATATAAAWGVQATATVEAAQAIAIVQAAEVEIARLAAERERIVYPVRAYGPWLMLFASLGLLIWGMVRLVRAYEIRLRAIPRDERGDSPVWVFEQRGQITIYDPDRSLGPATVFERGIITQPMLTDADRQERITRNDQMVDLSSRGLPGQRPPARTRAGEQMSQEEPQRPRVRIVDAAAVRPWLQDVRPQVLGAITDVAEGGER